VGIHVLLGNTVNDRPAAEDPNQKADSGCFGRGARYSAELLVHIPNSLPALFVAVSRRLAICATKKRCSQLILGLVTGAAMAGWCAFLILDVMRISTTKISAVVTVGVPFIAVIIVQSETLESPSLRIEVGHVEIRRWMLNCLCEKLRK